MEEKKKEKPAPTCDCGKQSKHIVYSTFEYFYCGECKKEVKEPEPKKKDPWGSWRAGTVAGAFSNQQAVSATQALASPNARPSGSVTTRQAFSPPIVAHKGEQIVCDQCLGTLGVLNEDLPEPLHRRPAPQGALLPYVDWSASPCPCGAGACAKASAYKHVRLMRVYNRGWV